MTALFLELPTGRVPVRLCRHPAARRFTLRVGPRAGMVGLSLPPNASLAAARRFLADHAAWAGARLAALPPPVPFAPGARLPLRGIAHVLAGAGSGRRAVWAEAGMLWVAGEPAHFSRRLGDWLRRAARVDLAARVAVHAARLGRAPARLTLRDPVSRWGSCSARGTLSFSWRLVLAPPEVLDYVAAHEVAHLALPHHGPRFWALLRDLVPDVAGPRAWLGRCGPDLHRYGPAARPLASGPHLL